LDGRVRWGDEREKRKMVEKGRRKKSALRGGRLKRQQ